MEQYAPMEDIQREMYIHGIIPDHLEETPHEVLDVRATSEFNRERISVSVKLRIGGGVVTLVLADLFKASNTGNHKVVSLDLLKAGL